MSLFSLFSQSLIKENFVFFDVETTGLFPLENDRIIELAMIKTSKGNIIDTIDMIINPGKSISEEVTRINNITNEMVKGAKIFDRDLGLKIIDFIEDFTLVAHNASFDLGFVSVELGKVGLAFESWKAIDTLKIASSIFPNQSNKLENLIRRYNILPEGNLHRALIDTDALRKIFFEFLEESDIRSKSIDLLIKNYGYQAQNVHRAIPAQIREAIIEKKIINGEYKTRIGERIKLSILPIAPIWINKKWYLLADNIETKEKIYLYCNNFISINS
jgi:DNA polymerase III epsilon subunit family exonuclease